MSATGLRNGYHQDTLTSIRRSRERGQHGASAGAGQQSNSLRETSDFSSSTSTLNSGKDVQTNYLNFSFHSQGNLKLYQAAHTLGFQTLLFYLEFQRNGKKKRKVTLLNAVLLMALTFKFHFDCCIKFYP